MNTKYGWIEKAIPERVAGMCRARKVCRAEMQAYWLENARLWMRENMRWAR